MALSYIDKTVSSGAVVKIRPRTYEEWEKQEEERLKSIEAVPNLAQGGNIQEVELSLQRANLAVRNSRLSVWVKDFDKVKGKLTLRDIAEIEQAALELEQMEIPLGNSETGGDGQ